MRFHERIRLGTSGAGQLVSEDQLVHAFTRAEAAQGRDPITIFEITTAAAFLLFAEHPADVLLLEVGLGGTFDATNVIDRPAASVITPVSLDHLEFLGTDVASIAHWKAGIIKRGAPVIIAPQPDAAREVIEFSAARAGAGPVLIGGQDFTVHEEHGRLVYQDDGGLLDLPLPRLPGRHQHVNAGTAIATLRTVMGAALEASSIESGLVSTDWPARLQRLSGNAIAMLPPGSEVWLDGAHNEDGGRVLASAVSEMGDRSDRPLVMIVGMLSTKDCATFFASFKGLVQRVLAVGISGQEAARPPEEIAAAARAIGLEAESFASVGQALTRIARHDWTVPPRVLIAGSLYFAGEVLAYDGSIPR